MISLRAPLAGLLIASSLLLGCDDGKSDGKAEPSAKAAPTDPAADNNSEDKGEQVSDPNALTEEDKRLIAADPKTLSPEENRKRAYALRKQVMQNPDSANAAALEDARKAALAGEIDPADIPGADKPAETKDQNMVIELPDHLKNPDGTPKTGEAEGAGDQAAPQ